ncbi:hypothetical protein, partial [Nocardia wallacei]|uniref:hypothetical protein n=1 Tax=Nocardia wallacei TaxID=480035 RepID=UPI0024561F7B
MARSRFTPPKKGILHAIAILGAAARADLGNARGENLNAVWKAPATGSARMRAFSGGFAASSA